jgi:predicted Zn-dependent protease
MRLHRSVVVAAAAALVTIACATNPATGRRQLILMSEDQEIQLGRDSDQQIRQEMGVYDDPALQQYVDRIGQRLARQSHRPNLPWTFTVVNEPAVNAFALPGGFIYLTRGMLPFLHDEAELAAVLGHEIGHVDARHSAAAYSQQVLAGGGLAIGGIFVPELQPFQDLAGAALGLLFLKHSRDAELESDRLGVEYAAASGWNPGGMPDLLTTLDRLDEASGSSRGVPNWALTHPPAADRVEAVRAAVAAVQAPAAGPDNTDELNRHLDGLVFGDSREQGMVRGRDFLHPELRFALRFPAGWEIVNSPSQVVAQPAGRTDVGLVLQVVPNPAGSIEQTARQTMSKAGFTEVSGRRSDLNGLPAYIGTYNGTMQNTAVAVRAAHIQAGGRVYLLAGLAPTSIYASVDDEFSDAIGTFRELSRAEADRIQPHRVDFRTVRGGESWQSIAETTGNVVKPSTLAIMNGSDPGSPPRAGARIRIIVGG